LHYDPEIGEWKWLVHQAYWIKENSVAAKRAHSIRIDRRPYPKSVLAWLYMTGEWPRFQIDHIDRNHSNDKWINLRLATSSQQKGNCFHWGNTSGVKNVFWSRSDNRWKISMRRGDIRIQKIFATKEAAIEARRMIGQELWGEFDRMYDNKASQ
jgi:hypothetical protein